MNPKLQSRRHWIKACLLAALSLNIWACDALAQDKADGASTQSPIALKDFFRRPAYTEMVASPSGRYLATTSSLHGRLNLILIDLENRTSKVLTSYDDIDVGRLQWGSDNHVLFSAIQVNAPSGEDSPRSGGLYVAAIDGSDVIQLALTHFQYERKQAGGFVFMQMMRPVPGSKNEIIAAAVVTNDESVDLYRVNLTNGKYRLLTQGRPSDRISRWILDSKLIPRVAVAHTAGATTGQLTFYRAGSEASWKEINRFDITKPPAFVPLAFDEDDKHLFVASNADGANMAIHRYNPDSGEFVELIAKHPQYDLGGSPQGEATASLLGDSKTHSVLGIRVDTDRVETIWMDDEQAKLQATIDATLAGRTNLIHRSGDGKRLLINSYNDTSPSRYYLFNGSNRTIEEIGASRPWLDGRLAQVHPFRLKARDGLDIPSFYVVPRDHKPGQRLPTIVHVHGGPMARDVHEGGRYGGSFGIVEAQILASRGYAVILPNFRITPEIGSKIYYAGFGAYGGQMSDDHEDAAKWAVDQGIADPRKICISGASYGGYAALHAVTRPSNPFACAISGLPVTDLSFQRKEADYAESKASVEYWRQVQGVKNWDDPLVHNMSPVNNAHKIKVPVFIYIGEKDTRTPPQQARRMAIELEKSGNPSKGFFVGKGEGHGYRVEATNVALYEQILKFLEESLGK
jgi:dipeptidyl aminopeptidase/acylaminoacyl peptidase